MSYDDSSWNKRETFHVDRWSENPIIHPEMPGLEGEAGSNINGPSLIRVPDWVKGRLGRYYLYFAHHRGEHIRLACADKLKGPYRIHEPGVLHASTGPGQGHIASPDVHVDHKNRQIRMYFHQPGGADSPIPGQVSYVATSEGGLNFQPRKEVLGKFYFRVVRHRGDWYAFAKNGNKDGIIYRSEDGLTNFEAGPHYLPGVRHTAPWIEGDTLYLLYSLAGDCPERILLSTAEVDGNWREWELSEPEIILEPERKYEGADLPLAPSSYGPAHGRVRQLRDPFVCREDGGLYMLYSVAGEQGIAGATLHRT
ncbi:MAG: hypothetical protein ACOCTQ_04970 [Planctomycetota bacterium]